jgi:formylglycine-generating enzyme required for sulfatase activity
VRVTPATARVEIDGVLAGVGSATRTFPRGSAVHRLTVRADGLLGERREFTAGFDEAITLAPRPTPHPQSCVWRDQRGCGLVRVDGGTFTFGQREALRSVVVPSVSVSAFLLDSHEVTVERFRAFWDAGHPGASVREPAPRAYSWTFNWTREARAAGREEHPINCVDWNTARAFCAWDGGRLPTEAEWEYAARGTAGRTYPWGNEPPDATRGNYAGIEGRRCSLAWGVLHEGDDRFCATAPVGSFPEAPSRFFDLGGNVWEWVEDAWSESPQRCWSSRQDPRCSLNVGGHVYRGGSFGGPGDENARSAARLGDRPEGRSANVGVRCARTP